jgi:hypothetical protein
VTSGTERWYQFEQVEILPRPYWVKAKTAAEARAKRNNEGVPDFAGFPSDLKIIGRGKLVTDPGTIECIEDRRQELRR